MQGRAQAACSTRASSPPHICSRPRDHAPKLICSSNSAGFLVAEGKRHGRAAVAVRLRVHESSNFIGRGGYFPAHVGQFVVPAYCIRASHAPSIKHSQFNDPLFLRQLLLKSACNALAPLAQVAAAALQLLQLALKVRLFRQQLVKLSLDLSF